MFEVDEEVANQSHTVKNMIEGAQGHLPQAPQTLPRTVAHMPLLTPACPHLLSHTDTGTEEMIPLPNVPGKILSKVIEYCKFHVEAAKQVDNKPAKTEDEIKQWDTEFVKVDQATLFDLILVSEPDTQRGCCCCWWCRRAAAAHVRVAAVGHTVRWQVTLLGDHVLSGRYAGVDWRSEHSCCQLGLLAMHACMPLPPRGCSATAALSTHHR
jgi:hypothetical protein